MKLTFVAIAASIAMASCAAPAPKNWYKSGGTQEQYGRDQITCRQYGMQSAQASGLSHNMFAEAVIIDEMNKCLRTLGYS